MQVVVTVRFTSNTIRLRVKENMLRDLFWNFNFASETVQILLGSEQRPLYAGGAISVNGNIVPNARTMCITPEDILVRARSPSHYGCCNLKPLRLRCAPLKPPSGPLRM